MHVDVCGLTMEKGGMIQIKYNNETGLGIVTGEHAAALLLVEQFSVFNNKGESYVYATATQEQAANIISELDLVVEESEIVYNDKDFKHWDQYQIMGKMGIKACIKNGIQEVYDYNRYLYNTEALSHKRVRIANEAD